MNCLKSEAIGKTMIINHHRKVKIKSVYEEFDCSIPDTVPSRTIHIIGMTEVNNVEVCVNMSIPVSGVEFQEDKSWWILKGKVGKDNLEIFIQIRKKRKRKIKAREDLGFFI